jgi:hypothetical protein
MKLLKIAITLIMITLIVVGAATVIPYQSAHKTSYLGYKALCPFTPYSTIISFAMAAAFYLLFKKVGP